jgi:toxin ParE1/3/4
MRDRDDIGSYISQDNPAAAIKLDQSFEMAGVRLGRFPLSGRPGDIDDTRELIPHPSYRIVYTVADQELLILRVVHTSRQWPPADSEAP